MYEKKTLTWSDDHGLELAQVRRLLFAHRLPYCCVIGGSLCACAGGRWPCFGPGGVLSLGCLCARPLPGSILLSMRWRGSQVTEFEVVEEDGHTVDSEGEEVHFQDSCCTIS